jgi:hypothetical protein
MNRRVKTVESVSVRLRHRCRSNSSEGVVAAKKEMEKVKPLVPRFHSKPAMVSLFSATAKPRSQRRYY